MDNLQIYVKSSPSDKQFRYNYVTVYIHRSLRIQNSFQGLANDIGLNNGCPDVVSFALYLSDIFSFYLNQDKSAIWNLSCILEFAIPVCYLLIYQIK